MPIPVTGLFEPSGGPDTFDLYSPNDIETGDVKSVLTAVAGGSFIAGVPAASPVGEIVVQRKSTTGAPSHSATEGTLCWSAFDDLLYVNSSSGSGTTWTEVGSGGGGDTWKTLDADSGADLVASGDDTLIVAGGSGIDTTNSTGPDTLTFALGALAGNWDAGSFKITAETLESDVLTGTPPLVVASTDLVVNLNAAFLNGVESSGFVAVETFDANSILKADSDNTPIVQTVAEQRLVGRITAGSITDLTVAQVKTLLDLTGTNSGDEISATTSAEGIVELATDGEDAANVVVQGNDSRLDDARTPSSHVLATTAGLGGEHSTSGLTAGQVLRATAATTAAFQSLVAADIPSLDTGKLTTGLLPVARGGTGVGTVALNKIMVGTGTSPITVTDLEYSSSVMKKTDAGNFTVRAAVGSTTIIGEAGGINLGDGTLRIMAPATTAKIDLGTLTGPFAFNNCVLANNLYLDADGSATTAALILGADQDAAMWHDGTDLFVKVASATGDISLDCLQLNIGRAAITSKIVLLGNADFFIDFAGNDLAINQGGAFVHKPTAASASSYVTSVGSLARDFTTNGWTSGGGETELLALTVGASDLDQTGEYLEIIAFGSFAANGANKTVKLRIDTTDLVSYVAAPNNQEWTIRAIVAKTAASTLKGYAFFSRDTYTETFIDTSITVTLTSAWNVSIRADGTTTNDVVLEGLLIRYM